MYEKYKRARNAAWQCLINCNIKALPVKLSQICNHYNSEVIENSVLPTDSPYVLAAEQRGKTVIENNRYYIIVRDTETYQARRYTIAHELGHIIIPTDDEYEAERFAIDILAPACVLWGCDIHSANEISEICNISKMAAEIRAKRMAVLYRRNAFLKSSLERRVYGQFADFIWEYKHNHS